MIRSDEMRRTQKITFSVIILMIMVVFCIARGQVKGNISGPVKLRGARAVKPDSNS